MLLYSNARGVISHALLELYFHDMLAIYILIFEIRKHVLICLIHNVLISEYVSCTLVVREESGWLNCLPI